MCFRVLPLGEGRVGPEIGTMTTVSGFGSTENAVKRCKSLNGDG
jgi:hypothetical protein